MKHKQPILVNSYTDAEAVKSWIRHQAHELGFGDCGFVSVHNPVFSEQMEKLRCWLKQGHHGQMSYLEKNHDKRANPSLLVEGSRTIISVRMDYLQQAPSPRQVTDTLFPNKAIIARYARGRDYHKVMRTRLKNLAKRIEQMLPQWQHLNIGANKEFVFRSFSDSAPIFERPLAAQAGLGWTGKHTLLINKQAGSFFVLGELFLSLLLPEDSPVPEHCGSCSACIDICPTNAITAPYELKAEACISYLTIEHKGVIDQRYRRGIGNRVFGCDDCQLICPWNRYAKIAVIDDFKPRHGLDNSKLIELWQWTEEEFLARTQGSPLKRTGYVHFLRNISIGLGNIAISNNPAGDKSAKKNYIETLACKLGEHGEVLDEHIIWAINEHKKSRFL